MKYLPMGPHHPAREDGEHSLYARTCPACGSPPWHWCAGLKGHGQDRMGGYHRAREAKAKTHNPLPDMSAKWKDWAQYEGLHPKPRPADLEV